MQQDPVVDPEGNTFERSAIEAWLQRSQTSPITRSILTASMLNPNRALADAILSFRQMRGDPDAGNSGGGLASASSIPGMHQTSPHVRAKTDAYSACARNRFAPAAARSSIFQLSLTHTRALSLSSSSIQLSRTLFLS